MLLFRSWLFLKKCPTKCRYHMRNWSVMVSARIPSSNASLQKYLRSINQKKDSRLLDMPLLLHLQYMERTLSIFGGSVCDARIQRKWHWQGFTMLQR
ncbi:diamine acetyltransferase 2-like isoform X2 [Lates japonicus]|uniref:Diamine acetyltransferase 2-like isoform X2 n=1 Tax=Lates japonicus TaxID=270547 RepID=A0AAD3M498_LATJO|nr:diamine acetyltransferase 2-like isoform X2 [Lates japonicus]